MPRPTELVKAVFADPVIAVVYGREQLDAFIASSAPAAMVANIELVDLPVVMRAMSDHNRYAIVNIDSCAGLAPDSGALAYLKGIGTKAVVTTRGSLVARIKALDMVAVQKVFVTDRSNLPRTSSGVRQSSPDVVQLMPSPVLHRLGEAELKAFLPFIASGFISTTDDVDYALARGALAASSHTEELWNYRPARKFH